MPKTRQQKQELVGSLTESFQNSKSVVFAQFNTLTVAQVDELRARCHEKNVRYIVAKKTLLRIAAKEAGVEFDPSHLEGEIATVFGFDDEAVPAKVLASFAKTNEALKFAGGLLERKFISVSEVKNLSLLPSKDELLVKLLGTLKGPLSGLVNVLSGNIRGLVQLLNQIKGSKV